MYVRCTWKKVVDSIDLANEDPKWVDTIQCFDCLKRTKWGESANLLSLLQLWHPSPHASGLGLDRALCISPQIPRPLNSDWIALLTAGFPIGRQHISWDFWFPQSHEPSPILYLVPPPPIYLILIYLLLVLFIWRILDNTDDKICKDAMKYDLENFC